MCKISCSDVPLQDVSHVALIFGLSFIRNGTFDNLDLTILLIVTIYEYRWADFESCADGFMNDDRHCTWSW